MWKKLKDNWKTYLLALLTAAVGWLSGDKAMEYSSTLGENPPRTEDPAPAPDTWTVSGWFTAEKVMSQPGFPSRKYTDNMGFYTVKVKSKKPPTESQVVEARGLNPENVTVKVEEVIPPDGWKEPAPEGPDKE